MKTVRTGLILLAACALAGCDTSFRAEPSASGRAPVGGLVLPSDGDSAAPVANPSIANPPVAAPATAAPPVAAAPAQPAANQPVLVPAEAGVGAKGRDYGGGIITEPIRTRFRAEQKIIFDQIKQAIAFYKASNGNAPKTHEAFMTEIIEANQIALPELPSGETYWYDPSKEELMVRKQGSEATP